MQNKRIILICKENSSFPMYFLGKKLEDQGNKVGYYFIHHTECFDVKNIFTKHTYYFFKDKLKDKKIYDVKNITQHFINNYKNPIIDKNYLNELEKKYTNFKCLNKQIVSSQMMSTPYHNRWYLNPSNYEQNLYWLQLNYKNTENIFDDFKPNVVLDLDCSEIQRTIINEICYYNKVPYIAVEHSRHEDFIIPTFKLGLEMENFFSDHYNLNLQNDLTFENEEIKNFKNKKKIISKRFHNHPTSELKFQYINELKSLILVIIHTLVNEFFLMNFVKKKYSCNIPIFANPFKSLAWSFLVRVKKLFFMSRFNSHFSEPDSQDKYVYMPLHVIPESTTFVKSPMYLDELSIIQSISKSLPISWKLYVKEHPAMIGQRPLSFYKKVRKLYNVKLIKLDYYDDPKNIIVNSKGVITISGSTALEAALLGKPAAVFAHVNFNIIDSIEVVQSIHHLSKILKNFKNFEDNNKQTKSCAAYLKTVKDLGRELDIKKLIQLSAKKIIKNSLNEKENEDLKKMINELYYFYSKALEFNNYGIFY